MNIDVLESVYRVGTYILFFIGRGLIFKKYNTKWWYTFIPVYKDYKLAECADDEENGYVWCITTLFYELFLFLYFLVDDLISAKSMMLYTILLLAFIFGIINIIYSYRVFTALSKSFNRKKAWAIPWTVFPGIISMLWGISSKFVPTIIEDDELAVSNRESNIKAEALKEGLTVDINKRTAISRFRRKVMLRDIHLNINPGKMVLLLGGSGAGKTTFFNAITGYEKADATILLNGGNVYDDFDKMKYEIGFVPQQELLRTTDTVIRTLEDSALLRLPKSVTRAERNARINEVMEKFGLTHIKDNVISKQSGGQKKRISIAMEYISDPALFILDEPDSGLDGILAKELMSGLHEISREGKIVIVVTHTPDRVIEYFDEVIVLAKDSSRTGRLVFKGTIDEAKKFFEADSMEGIVKKINRPDEGGDGKADELIAKYWEVSHAKQ